MAVAKKRPKMRRTQVCLSQEEYDLAKRRAAERGVSLSQVIRDGLRRETRGLGDPLRDIIGIVEGMDPDASTKIDEILYGECSD